jgi:hypothetical protein
MPETVQLACAGIALVASQVGLIWLTWGLTHAVATTVTSVAPLILGLALPAALLLMLAPRLARLEPSRAALLLVFVLGLALRAVWLGAPVPLEDDFKRYLWDGAVVAHGLDPYRYSPEQILHRTPPGYESIATAGRETLEAIYFPDLRTIYPSVAQLSFALAHLAAPFQIDGLRAVFLAAEIATFTLVCALLADIKASPLWSMLYWWNPTVAFALVGIAHVDAVVPPFVLGAVLLASRNRTAAAAALLGAGAGVKMWPVLLAPLGLARGWCLPRLSMDSVVLLAAVALAIGPVLLSTQAPHSGLAVYAASWGNNNAFFAWAAYALGSLVGNDVAQRLLRAAVVAVRCEWTTQALVRASLVVAATVFYLSPAQFPWYAVWFLPMAAVMRSWPLLFASVTLPAYYLFYPLWGSGRGDAFFFGAAFLHSVPVLGWIVVDAVLSRQACRGAGAR